MQQYAKNSITFFGGKAPDLVGLAMYAGGEGAGNFVISYYFLKWPAVMKNQLRAKISQRPVDIGISNCYSPIQRPVLVNSIG